MAKVSYGEKQDQKAPRPIALLNDSFGNRRFLKEWVTLNANLRGKGASPTNDFWHQKSRVPGLSYGEKIIAEKFNRLSRVHQRHRQTTDRQTDNRRTADSIL